MRTVEDFIKSYKGVHTSTMLKVLRSYNEWESGKNEWNEKKKWKRGSEQLKETKAIENILYSRGINYEKIVGKRKKVLRDLGFLNE